MSPWPRSRLDTEDTASFSGSAMHTLTRRLEEDDVPELREDRGWEEGAEDSVEEDALRFLEMPMEKVGRRRRLLAQLAENTKSLDAWLRRAGETHEATGCESISLSPAVSQLQKPRAAAPSRRPRQLVIKGSVRQGAGIRRPRPYQPETPCCGQDMAIGRDPEWGAQEQAAIQRLHDVRPVRGEAYCRTPSFGMEASEASPGSGREDEFADEVRAIVDCSLAPSMEGRLSPSSPSPSGGDGSRPSSRRERVTVADGRPDLRTPGNDSEEDRRREAMEREERMFRFCPEVVDHAFSKEFQQLLQQSLVRGASKVLAEHRGHQRNLKAKREDTEESLRLALSVHARAQHCAARRARISPPPLQGAPLRPCSSVRQSPDLQRLRQEIPRKSAIIAARKKRRKQRMQGFEEQTLRRESFARERNSRRFEPVPCSSETSNWRAPSPMQLRLAGPGAEDIVVGSQWRDFLEELRLERGGRRRRSVVPTQTSQEGVDAGGRVERTRELLETKVEDCPDAHALHLARQGKLQALQRWDGLRLVRQPMLCQILFQSARLGQVQILRYLLEELSSMHRSDEALHWREKGNARTLLHAAAEADLVAVCGLLEELGADMKVPDEDGRQPWQVAGPFCAEIWHAYGSWHRYCESEKVGGLQATLRLNKSPFEVSTESKHRGTRQETRFF